MEWVKGAGGQSIPLYNQTALEMTKHGDLVFIVEGEKDVDTLTKYGRLAVSSPHGATHGNPKGKWIQSYTDKLKVYNVVIIQDNDEVRKAYAHSRGHFSFTNRN